MTDLRQTGAVSRDVLEALRDLIAGVAAAIHEFPDAIDKRELRDALQLLLDVAIEHDRRGGYGIYAEDEA